MAPTITNILGGARGISPCRRPSDGQRDDSHKSLSTPNFTLGLVRRDGVHALIIAPQYARSIAEIAALCGSCTGRVRLGTAAATSQSKATKEASQIYARWRED